MSDIPKVSPEGHLKSWIGISKGTVLDDILGYYNCFPLSHFLLFLQFKWAWLSHRLGEAYGWGESRFCGKLGSQGKEICYQRSILKGEIFLLANREIASGLRKETEGPECRAPVFPRAPRRGYWAGGRGLTEAVAIWKGADDASLVTCASWGPNGPPLQSFGSHVYQEKQQQLEGWSWAGYSLKFRNEVVKNKIFLVFLSLHSHAKVPVCYQLQASRQSPFHMWRVKTQNIYHQKSKTCLWNLTAKLNEKGLHLDAGTTWKAH